MKSRALRRTGHVAQHEMEEKWIQRADRKILKKEMYRNIKEYIRG
jgi:hypothetical protein